MDACCRYCGADLSKFESPKIHIGRCRRTQERIVQLQSQGSAFTDEACSSPTLAAAVSDDEAPQAMDVDVDSVDVASQATMPPSPMAAPPAPPAIPFSPLGSAADDFLASMIVRTPSLTLAIIKDIFTLISLGPMTSTGSPQLFRKIDALPGPEFVKEFVSVDGVSYTVFRRDIVEMLKGSIRRLSSSLMVPELHARGEAVSEIWQGSKYQEHLRAFRSVAPANAILMPLIFFSGTFTCFSNSRPHITHVSRL